MRQWADPLASMCRVLFAPLSAIDDGQDSLLSTSERARRGRYVQADDRSRFTLATVLLKGAAAVWLSVGPEDIVIDRTCDRCGEPHGRPRILDSGLRASISHSGGFVAVALTAVADVGIDIEAIDEQRPYEPLIDYVCGPSERSYVGAREDLYVCWTRKESILKAVGVGLAVPMVELTVTAPAAPPALTAYRGGDLAVHMADVSPGPGYAGAVTVLSSGRVDFTVEDGRAVEAMLRHLPAWGTA